MPPGFVGSELEWIVFDDLTRLRRYVQNRDFYYGNVDLFLPGYLRAGSFRADFVILYGPSRKLGPGAYEALVLDPFDYYTHPDLELDIMRRNLLTQAGYLYIRLEGTALRNDPHGMVGLALRGIDRSEY